MPALTDTATQTVRPVRYSTDSDATASAPSSHTKRPSSLLRPLGLPALKILASTIKGRPKRFASRQTFITKGDPASHIYLVVDGMVKLVSASEEGKEITFAILGPGEIIGECSLLDGLEHAESVTALEPTELLAFERRDFITFLQEHPSFAFELLRTISARLRWTTELAEDISLLPLSIRLAKKVLALARAYGIDTANGIRIGLHLCQQDLANMVGTTRESVNKQLALWQEENLVFVDKGFLTITHPRTFAARHHLA